MTIKKIIYKDIVSIYLDLYKEKSRTVVNVVLSLHIPHNVGICLNICAAVM
jgi:hypothetical protein